MRLGLFILSVTGVLLSGYEFINELGKFGGNEHIIYLSLLGILLCNCVLGAAINFPDTFFVKNRFKVAQKSNSVQQ